MRRLLRRRFHTDPVAARRRRRRIRRIVAKTLKWGFVIAVLLSIDAAYAAWNLQSTLRAAADHLRAGSEAARDSDFPQAESEFDQALDEAESAVLTSHHPAPFVAQFLPYVNRDARAVRDLARVGELTSRAGVAAVDAAEQMGASDQGLAGSVFSNGQIDFAAADQGHPFIKEIDALMADAAEIVVDGPTPRFGPVKTAMDEAQDRIPSASETAHKANVFFDALPGLFAQEGVRDYLLIFQAPSDQRGGSGGIIGLYGVLEARAGRVELVELGSPYEEGLSPTRLARSQVPDWYARSYSWAAALREWQSVNISPHFPVVSEVLLAMYEKETGDRLDGVVSLDPVAFAELTKATGPLEGEGMDVTVDSSNAVDVLARDVYTVFNNDNNSQNQYLQAIMTNFWERFSSGNVEPVELAEAFGEAARTQHFKMYVTDAEDGAALDELDTSADYTEHDPNVQMVFNENVAGNKVDYFLHRTVETTVRVKEDGSAEVTATATLNNKAPTGPPSLLLGPGFKTDPIGLNAMYINFLLPDNSQIEQFLINDRRLRPLKLREEDHPIASEIVLVEAGETGTTSITYTVPEAAEIEDGEGSLEWTLWPQTTINPDRYELTINPPYGYRIEGTEGVSPNEAALEASGALDQPRTFTANFEER